MLRGEIDFAVHSAKDLPAELAPGLRIGAYPVREDARDVFISRGNVALAALPQGAKVATSSLRRKVQLLTVRRDLEILPMRGNVDTRLRKRAEGYCDGLILAAAGLRRLGREDVAAQPIAMDLMGPSPGQGALGIEVPERGGKAAEFLARLADAGTRLAVEFERAFLKAFGGGCSTPLGAHATVPGPGLSTPAFYAGVDGSRVVAPSWSLRCSISAQSSLPRFEVRMTTVFLKSTTVPCPSVRRPSSSNWSRMLYTSAWAFSISSNRTRLYGRRRTGSVNCPPSS